MITKKIRALLYYVKLWASSRIHLRIQTGVTVRKRSVRVEIGDTFSRMTLKFDGWPWRAIGHLFCTTSSFAHHFTSIGEVKLELQSRLHSGQNCYLFVLRDHDIRWMTLKTIRHLIYSTLSFVHHFKANWWIQTGATVRKGPILVKIGNFLSPVTLKFDRWP